MRVRLYPINLTGCGTYRMIQPARVLAEQGVECEVERGIPATINERDEVVAVDPIDADVIVLQTPPLHIARAIPLIQKQGVRVVIDIDDDLTALPLKVPTEIRRAHRDSGHIKACRVAARTADLVTVTTPALAQRFNHRASILPNYIDESLLAIPRADDGASIGWGGMAHEHPYDFERVGAGLDIPGTRFLVAGTCPPVWHSRIEQSGPIGYLPDYHRALSHFTIGVAPLQDNAFTRAKSWLKPLEYMALGIPCIRSSTPEYDRLGYGFVARNQRHWRKWAHLLLRSPWMRDEISEAARERAATLTIQRNAWRWAEAWETTLTKKRTTGTLRAVS